jgi:hypothetical protein
MLRFSRGFLAPCGCCPVPATAKAASVNRRQFVASGVATLGVGISIAEPARLLAQAQPNRIDVHHHISSVPWVDALKKALRTRRR